MLWIIIEVPTNTIATFIRTLDGLLEVAKYSDKKRLIEKLLN